ncbi:hypothetical protein CTA2_3184 [Colletotrichum tanaceti]|nr:hypothetical protein CTA2_3184 [Colletotrichum tanaceti]
MSVQPASSSTPPKEGRICKLDEAASILRVASYHRKDFNLAVIHLDPHKFAHNGRVKYIVTTQGTLHGDALLMPLFSLPPLPYSRDDWTVATVSRSNETGELVPLLSNLTTIAKVARFEWEIPRMERGTHAYRLLEGTGIATRFLGHVHEQERTVGMLLEKIEDSRSAGAFDAADTFDHFAVLWRDKHGRGFTGARKDSLCGYFKGHL